MYEQSDPSTVSSYVFKHTIMWCNRWEQINLSPITAPTYSSQERSVLELWRQQVRLIIENRLAAYSKSDSSTATNTTIRLPLPEFRCKHKMFRIPELLDAVLHFAGPTVQIVALNVSRAWRCSSTSVIGSRKNLDGFRFPQPCDSVEYGQSFDPGRSEPVLSMDEMKRFGLQLHRTIERRQRTLGNKYIYFPARLTQLHDLSTDIAQALDTLNNEQSQPLLRGITPSPGNTKVSWLDLSQVQINPYFEHLFTRDGRIQHHLGGWEITLRTSLNAQVLDRTPDIQLLLESVGSMHVTYPPCKTLGIYHTATDTEESRPGFNKLLSRVHNEDGILIKELIDALEGCAPTVVASWKRDVEEFHRYVAEMHWIDDIWTLPAVPTISVFMDSYEMPDGEFDFDAIEDSSGTAAAQTAAVARMGCGAQITRVAYMSARHFRASREGAWIPKELFEPMESEAGRAPIA
jgi:hypothetical protein